MGEVNVLSGGIEILEEMKANVSELDQLKIRSSELAAEQKQLQKQLDARKKEMESEISSTVSKRQSEVEESFDGRVEATRARIKKVKADREKEKASAVSERIASDTSELNEEIRTCREDIKGIFMKHHISRAFNTDFFFTYFMPDGMFDFMAILITAIFFLVLPWGVRYFLPEALRVWWMMVCMYAVIVVVFGGIYALIYCKVRKKHTEALREAAMLREKIARIRKKIKSKEKSIIKDKDESGYGLEKIDEELESLDRRIDNIINEKKQALTEFENSTKIDITNQIRAGYEQDLTKLKSDYDNAYEEQRGVDARINSFTMEISRKYESYVGKENLTVPMIDSLIEIINGGDALTIADALAFYKRQLSEEKKN